MDKADGRATSNNRSTLETDVSDFMNGLESLDKNEKLDPIFAAEDYGKISMTITPEEACSSISMAVRMTKVETMLTILRKDMEEQTENVSTLFDVMYKNHHMPTR